MHFYKKFLFIFLLILLFVPLLSFGAGNNTSYEFSLRFTPPCIKLGIAGFDSCTTPDSIMGYIVRLYQFAVGISGVVAVGMIVAGAILIIVKSESVTAKSEGKDMITSALWGMALLFGSYLLLKTINPELVKLKAPYEDNTQLATSSSPTFAETLASSTCGIAASIPGVAEAKIYGTTPQVNNTCTYRRLYDGDGMQITDNSGEASNYYYEDEGISAGSIIWMYPYFIKGQDPKTTARCLVYAYRSSLDKVLNQVQKIDLNPGVTPCYLPEGGKQEDGWSLGAGGTTIATSTQQIDVAKNLDFKYFAGANTSSCNPKSETSPGGAIRSVQQGIPPYVCYSGCNKSGAKPCEPNGTTHSNNLLYLFQQMQNGVASGTIPQYVIGSLTGGSHTSNSSHHYLGYAADVWASSGSISDYNKLLPAIKSYGATTARCEYFVKSTGKLIIDYNSCSGFSSSTHEALHLHVEYP